MNDHDDDPHLHARFNELREHEAARTPSFEQVLRGPAPAARRSRSAWWWPIAAAATLAIVALFRWPSRPPADALPDLSPGALADLTNTALLPSADWAAPTDALLADTTPASAAALSREITQLLNRP